ncbi:hypothetical protein DFO45_2302 [Azorhizobium sp. AG788]|uniref:hypothetical protein n=1 Tax=Azorhizobium sp. AG788 TaxID=2183897 RepID=UPI0010616183|nr:hypothetical protein [Azorhizobium sp. AG788]TDT94552.1 hypothetical protein DFO45_2302 [Azorhizobium sp. AG788]
MSLTFPRSYPFAVLGLSSLVFTPSRVQVTSRARGGLVQGAETGRTLWSVQGQTPELNEDEFEEMQAFFDSLRGVLNTFMLYDPARIRPRAYPGSGWAGVTRAMGGAFDGTAFLSLASAYSLSLTGLPLGYRIMAGDMLSWAWGSSRTLHRAVETVTASGGGVTVQVEPDIPPGSAVGATVKLEAADAVFKLTGELPQPRRRTVGGEPISFSAIQVLR